MKTLMRLSIASLSAFAATLTAVRAAGFDSGAISGLGIRNIGSAEMSGRIAAIAGRHEKDGKTTLFVGAASGGVWKSSDGGTTFQPVFDKQPVQSIGAIALDPQHHETVWVGTGESWTRNSVSIGDGIYKSTDGGENWTNVGLPNSERITRIIRKTAMSCTRACPGNSGAIAPTAACTARPTAAPTGRKCSRDRTCRPAVLP